MEKENKGLDTYGAIIGICIILIALTIGGISIFSKKLKQYGEVKKQEVTATTTVDEFEIEAIEDVTLDISEGL
jgi:uncharacterized protein YpmB